MIGKRVITQICNFEEILREPATPGVRPRSFKRRRHVELDVTVSQGIANEIGNLINLAHSEARAKTSSNGGGLPPWRPNKDSGYGDEQLLLALQSSPLAKESEVPGGVLKLIQDYCVGFIGLCRKCETEEIFSRTQARMYVCEECQQYRHRGGVWIVRYDAAWSGRDEAK